MAMGNFYGSSHVCLRLTLSNCSGWTLKIPGQHGETYKIIRLLHGSFSQTCLNKRDSYRLLAATYPIHYIYIYIQDYQVISSTINLAETNPFSPTQS